MSLEEPRACVNPLKKTIHPRKSGNAENELTRHLRQRKPIRRAGAGEAGAKAAFGRGTPLIPRFPHFRGCILCVSLSSLARARQTIAIDLAEVRSRQGVEKHHLPRILVGL